MYRYFLEPGKESLTSNLRAGSTVLYQLFSMRNANAILRYKPRIFLIQAGEGSVTEVYGQKLTSLIKSKHTI